MTPDIKELVTYIRSVHEWCARTKSGGDWFAIDTDESPFKAADALEALAGEVEKVTKERDVSWAERKIWITGFNEQEVRAEAAEAERDRLAGEVASLKTRHDAYVELTREALEQAALDKAQRDRLKAALVKARHELVTHNGLYATDIYPENREQLLQNGVNIEWQIDVSAVLEAIDAALGDAS